MDILTILAIWSRKFKKTEVLSLTQTQYFNLKIALHCFSMKGMSLSPNSSKEIGNIFK